MYFFLDLRFTFVYYASMPNKHTSKTELEPILKIKSKLPLLGKGRSMVWLAHEMGLSRSGLYKVIEGRIASEARRDRLCEILGFEKPDLWPS